MRRAARTDRNHAEIRDRLRQIPGVSVYDTSGVGHGFPDLVVGARGITRLLEIKDGAKAPSARALTPDQRRFIAAWHGSQVHVVETLAQALICLGLPAQEDR